MLNCCQSKDIYYQICIDNALDGLILRTDQFDLENPAFIVSLQVFTENTQNSSRSSTTIDLQDRIKSLNNRVISSNQVKDRELIRQIFDERVMLKLNEFKGCSQEEQLKQNLNFLNNQSVSVDDLNSFQTLNPNSQDIIICLICSAMKVKDKPFTAESRKVSDTSDPTPAQKVFDSIRPLISIPGMSIEQKEVVLMQVLNCLKANQYHLNDLMDLIHPVIQQVSGIHQINSVISITDYASRYYYNAEALKQAIHFIRSFITQGMSEEEKGLVILFFSNFKAWKSLEVDDGKILSRHPNAITIMKNAADSIIFIFDSSLSSGDKTIMIVSFIQFANNGNIRLINHLANAVKWLDGNRAKEILVEIAGKTNVTYEEIQRIRKNAEQSMNEYLTEFLQRNFDLQKNPEFLGELKKVTLLMNRATIDELIKGIDLLIEDISSDLRKEMLFRTFIDKFKKHPPLEVINEATVLVKSCRSPEEKFNKLWF